MTADPPATPAKQPNDANDGTELYVKPKAKPAPPPAEPAKAVGGAEEMPGSPRPAKPGRSSIPEQSDADHRRQTPGRVEEDAEIWDGKKWVLPSGKAVDPDAPAGGPSAEERAKHDPSKPTIEADEDTEVISTPRRHHEESAPQPIFGTSRDIIRSSGAGKGKTGKEGQDFQEYQRPLVPDTSQRTFGLGGYIGADPARPRDTSDTMDLKAMPRQASAGTQASPPSIHPYLGANATTPTSALPSRPGGGTQVWPPPAGGHPMAQPPAVPGSVAHAPPGQVHAKALPPGTLNVLLVGSGAREHAMALAIRRSARSQLFVVTKHRNPGLVKSATGFKILDDRDAAGIVAFAKMQKIHLAVVGPEAPLEAGVGDALRAAGIAVASPSQAAARIETSKTFMRELMERHDVPGRLAFHAFTDPKSALHFLDKHGPEWAIKPVGLTGGKGVQVFGDHFHDVDGAKAYVQSVFTGKVGGGAVQFEELARGEEYTIMAFTDGTAVLPMSAVQDHKRLYEGDKGPNTGGMGSYSQADGLLPFLNETDYAESVRVLQGLVDALRADGTPYVGTIYGQFMLTAAGPKVIEVNARFGDPEAMNVLHLLESDYLGLLEAMATGTLAGKQARFRQAATVVKYVVPRGYGDGTPASGRQIEVDDFNVKRVKGFVYFANVEQQPTGPLTTMASRAVAVLGEGPTVEHANAVCEAALKHVHGDALFVRHDIGTPQLLAQRVHHMNAIRGQVAQ